VADGTTHLGDGFGGSGENGQLVVGGGITIGIGAGSGSSVTITILLLEIQLKFANNL